MQANIDEIDCASIEYLFNAIPPHPHLQVSVIVPVRNEAHHVVNTLEALRNQQNSSGSPLNPALYEVLLLANNCTDRSYDIARSYQQQHPDFSLHIARIHLPPAKANIGTVRRLLMDEAHRRLNGSNCPNGIIASTDGDTIVDIQWVYQIMREIANGNDAVGGRILTQPDQSRVRLYHLRDVMYRTLVAKAEALLDPCINDPWPRHFQHFGASIAVTCQMYERAGRLPEKPFLEDEAFYKALVRTDAKIRKSPHVKVVTSSRMQGRVAVGFSEQLSCWSRMEQANQCQVAEPADAVITRLRNRQRLRHYWQTRGQSISLYPLQAVASELFVDSVWLINKAQKSRFFGELWEKVEEKMAMGKWATQWQPVPITAAIQDLRNHLIDVTC